MWDQVMFGQGLRKYRMQHLHARRLYQGSSLQEDSSQEKVMEHIHKSAPAKDRNKHLPWSAVGTGNKSLRFYPSSTLGRSYM